MLRERKCLAVKRERNGGIFGRAFAGKAVAAAVLLLSLQAALQGCARAEGRTEGAGTLKEAMLGELADRAEKAIYGSFLCGLTFLQERERNSYWLVQEQIDSVLPFYGYLMERPGGDTDGEGERRFLLTEAEERGEIPEDGAEQESGAGAGSGAPEYAAGREGPEEGGEAQEGSGRMWEDLLREENEAALLRQQESAPDTPDTYGNFTPHGLQSPIDLNALGSYETLLKEFYTVDPNTMAGSSQLDADRLASKDLTIDKGTEGPQILIYHTHSQEAFSDSVPGDDSTGIQGVGERLAEILRNTYGYQVLHHTGEYDVEGRDDAYANALPAIRQVLEENPSIQVVIDLHRDEMPESTRLVMDLDGRPTARFMFFNGLSRTRTTGDIDYLYNEYLDDNLAFSFQMQRKAMEYYPGLARKIYLKGYRYNMHLKPRSLLIELGAQNNTLEEAMNACDPLAHILDLVLSGE